VFHSYEVATIFVHSAIVVLTTAVFDYRDLVVKENCGAGLWRRAILLPALWNIRMAEIICLCCGSLS